MPYRQGKKPKPVTPERLNNAAIAYMGRFSTTAANLRRVLLRRVQKAEDMEPERKAELARHIDGLIEKYQAMGYLDDRTYIEGKMVSLRRAGASKRAIGMKLMIKGAAREDIATALSADEESDEVAAWIFARRKKLGPYRDDDIRHDFRQKDMAAMGRAGFDYQTARGVIDAVAPPDTTER